MCIIKKTVRFLYTGNILFSQINFKIRGYYVHNPYRIWKAIVILFIFYNEGFLFYNG